MSDADPYTDSNGVLKNLLGITDEQQLARIESDVTRFRLEQLRQQPLAGNYDLNHLLAINRHIGQDLYGWAGEIRTVNIGKGNTLFAPPEHIEREAGKLFQKLASENFLKGMFTPRYVERVAHYLTEINALHPARELNGRTQRAFMEQLSNQAGKPLDFSVISRDANILGFTLAHHSGSKHLEPLVNSALKAGERSRGFER